MSGLSITGFLKYAERRPGSRMVVDLVLNYFLGKGSRKNKLFS